MDISSQMSNVHIFVELLAYNDKNNTMIPLLVFYFMHICYSQCHLLCTGKSANEHGLVTQYDGGIYFCNAFVQYNYTTLAQDE